MSTTTRAIRIAADGEHFADVRVIASHPCADDPDPTTSCAEAGCDVVLSQVILRELTDAEPFTATAIALPAWAIEELVEALINSRRPGAVG